MKKLFTILFLFSLFCKGQPVVNKIDPSVLHIDGSILLTCGFSQLHYNLSKNKNRATSILVGAASSLFIGIVGKEIIHDKLLDRGVYSVFDMADDTLGTACGVIIMICKFDFDERGLVKWGSTAKPRRSKFDEKKYILD